ncbi:myosin [Thraustotheca clavata]|uniref:Myosin n=1 Tax=Thraustotheca clavata TaxID=74557 RepID=A0A1V9YVG4_9STRA|nr:myosin [Thraustotheca clavata]
MSSTMFTEKSNELDDAQLLRENERLEQQVLALESKLIQAEEVSLISAKVVDSRITCRDGKQFVEYKLQIEMNYQGNLYMWHQYSTFRNLATTFLTKNGNCRKDIPKLPRKLFTSFSDKFIRHCIQLLNEFLDAAMNAEYLSWGILVDQDTCAYKRRGQICSKAIDSTDNSELIASSTSSSDAINSPQSS